MQGATLWVIAALVAAVVLLLVAAPAEEAPKLAPDFSLRTLNEDVVTLSSLRGSVVILDFWASWCAPCTRTLPGLEELASRLADRGVVFLAVSLDRTAGAAQQYADSQNLPRAGVLYGSLKEARAVRDLYRVVGIPHTFVIDRDGWIQFSGVPSGVTEELLESLLANPS